MSDILMLSGFVAWRAVEIGAIVLVWCGVRRSAGGAAAQPAAVAAEQSAGSEETVPPVSGGWKLNETAKAVLDRAGRLALPLAGIACVILLWAAASSTVAVNLPSPAKTWEASKPYVLEPFAKRGELDQGILRFTWYSLILVAKGYTLAILIGTPLGLLLGASTVFARAFDPLIQILRPVSPLAWLPLGLVLFQKSEPSAVFTIAVCSMWPTVLNTAVGVRAVPQDYINVARVLKLSRMQTLFKVLIPATLPYMFTGFRLSLGIAWLVIVAAEMLTGTPGVGGFLWQEYNSLIYEHIILCILTIGLVGFGLDRLMSLAEQRFKAAA